MDNAAFDACMERMRQGDRQALREVYDAYLNYCFYYVLSIVGNYEDAQDVTSELFLRIWKQAGQYRPGGGHKRWLSTIAHNMAVDFLRSRGREMPAEPEQMEEYETGAEDPALMDVIETDSVSRALEVLTPAEREVVHLKVVGELTLKEIAEFLSAPMGTVAWRYRQGIMKLRRCGYESGF